LRIFSSMKILTETSSIRSAIKDLLCDADEERVVIGNGLRNMDIHIQRHGHLHQSLTAKTETKR
jgi:hypothetical protein